MSLSTLLAAITDQQLEEIYEQTRSTDVNFDLIVDERNRRQEERDRREDEAYKRWLRNPDAIVWVSAYHVQRAYGGPEEGGWYFDAGELLATLRTTRASAMAIELLLAEEYEEYNDPQPLSNVNSDGKLQIIWSQAPGRSYPEETPRYS